MPLNNDGLALRVVINCSRAEAVSIMRRPFIEGTQGTRFGAAYAPAVAPPGEGLPSFRKLFGLLFNEGRNEEVSPPRVDESGEGLERRTFQKSDDDNETVRVEFL